MKPEQSSSFNSHLISLYGNRLPPVSPLRAENSLAERISPYPHLLTVNGTGEDLLSFLETLGIRQKGSAQELLQVLIERFWEPGKCFRAGACPSLVKPPDLMQGIYLDKMAFLTAQRAPQTDYGDALLMGGPMSWVRARLAHLASEWQRGVRFNRLIMLSGDRPLNPLSESIHNLLRPSAALPIRQDWRYQGESLADETDMMRLVFAQSALPPAMQKVESIFVKEVRGKSLRNASSSDSVHRFIDEHKPLSEKPVLIASSQPFVSYQTFSTAAVYLERGISGPAYAGIGPGQARPGYLAQYIDLIIRRLARELPFYQLPAL